MRTI
jgi:hypothetical protein